jgi:hypothetical protein
MPSYTIFGVVVGIIGGCWFGWHVMKPVPTGTYWPGWWNRSREFSVIGLRIYAVGGLFDSAGFAAVTFFPAAKPFVAGIALMVSGALLQGVAVVMFSRRGLATRSEPMPPSEAIAGHPRFRWYFALLVPAWIAALVATGWLIGLALPRYGPIPAGGYSKVSATVVATYPADHNQVKYSYSVGGRTYEGVWFADGLDGSASQLRVGQAITIWYEVGNPARSCDCSDPHKLQRTDNDPEPITVFAFLVITAAFALVGGRLLLGSWQALADFVRVVTSSRWNTRSVRYPGSPGPPSQP